MKQIQYEVRCGEYADAMRSVRLGRMVLWLICGAAILTQIAAFLLVEYGGVIGFRTGRKVATAAVRTPAAPSTKPATATAPAAATTTKPAAAVAATTSTPTTAPAAPAAVVESDTARQWKGALHWLLPVSKFVALIFSFLLVLTTMFTIMLSLVGRLGGARGLVAAWFWSLLLLAVLVPWQNVLVGSKFAAGALFSFGEFIDARAASNPEVFWPDQVLYFGRFLVYPLVAMIFWLVLHLKYSGGCARMDFPQGESVETSVAVRTDAAAAPGATPAAATDAPAGAAAADPAARKPLNPIAAKFYGGAKET